MVKNGKLVIRIVKQPNGSLKATSLTFTGSLEDLNDYDYFGALVKGQLVSRTGASVQIGWEGIARTEGNIFFNQLNFGKAFAPADGFDILEYVSEIAVENLTLP